MVYTTLVRAVSLLACLTLLWVPNSQANPVSFQTVVTASSEAAAPDERLAYGSLPDQFGLLWLPAQQSPAQLVVLIHGGCWLQNYDVSHIRAAVVGLAAITDITSYAEGANGCQQAARWFMGAAPTDNSANALFQQANPRLQELNTAITLLASTADGIVPITQADYLRTAQVVRLSDAGHFDFIYPMSSAWQQLRATLQTISPVSERQR